jgi:hypothetical protein
MNFIVDSNLKEHQLHPSAIYLEVNKKHNMLIINFGLLTPCSIRRPQTFALADPLPGQHTNMRAPFTPCYKLSVLSNDLGMDSKC